MYTDKDFIKKLQNSFFKYLGFSLDDIFSMTVNDSYLTLQESLILQKKMIDQNRHLQNIKESLEQTELFINNSKSS